MFNFNSPSLVSPEKSFKPMNMTPTKGGLLAHNVSMEATGGSSVQGNSIVNYPAPAMFAGKF